jgi:hypothetical protein
LNSIGDMVSSSGSFRRQRTRLDGMPVMPVVLLFIPFFSVTLLTFFVGFESSVRPKSRIEPFVHESAPAADHALWLSIGVSENTIIVNTASGETFRWPVEGPSQRDYEVFETYMTTWAKHHLQNVVRSGQITSDTNLAAIAIDQKLTYHHVRPVIYALAAAGISKYGFETRLPQKPEASAQ